MLPETRPPSPPPVPVAPGRRLLTILCLALAWVALALFAANVATHGVADALCCADDAFFAVAAKNLATQGAYVASYWPGRDGSLNRTPFVLMTTGPAVIVPAALAIRVVGNRYWAPGAAVVLLNGLLLAIALGRLARLAAGPRRWAIATIAAVVALNVVTIGHYEHWYTLLGEMPAMLLVVLGATFLMDPRGRRLDAVLGGLFLGLAAQAKPLAALAFPVALAVYLLWRRYTTARAPSPADGARTREAIAAALLATVAALAPTLVFEGYKLVALGPRDYAAVTAAEAQFVEGHEGTSRGIFAGGRPLAWLEANEVTNWHRLREYFPPYAAAALLLSLGLTLAARRRWRGEEPAPSIALAACAAGFATWWLFFAAGGRFRYLLIGLGLWCFAVAFDLGTGRWSLRKAVVLIALVVALAPRAQLAGWIAPHRPLFSPSPRVTAMLAAIDFLEHHRAGRVIVADWWASGVDAEYLLAGTFNLTHDRSLARVGNPDALWFENAKWIDVVPGLRAQWNGIVASSGAVKVFEQRPYRIYARSSLVSPTAARSRARPAL